THWASFPQRRAGRKVRLQSRARAVAAHRRKSEVPSYVASFLGSLERVGRTPSRTPRRKFVSRRSARRSRGRQKKTLRRECTSGYRPEARQPTTFLLSQSVGLPIPAGGEFGRLPHAPDTTASTESTRPTRM